MLEQASIESFAERLDQAEVNCRPIAKITDECPQMDWRDAYAVQAALRRRKERRGDRIVGVKAGLTSFAKMSQMGVTEPVMGFLTAGGMIVDGGAIDTSKLIHPKIEAEIGFVLKSPLGKGCDVDDVLAATDFVLPAAEIIDSRYENFRFDLKSVIADNTSAARFVTGGRPREVSGLDLANIGIVIEKNGEIVTTVAGSAVLGHPAMSVAMLAAMMADQGETLPLGQLIMTGGANEAISVAPGDFISIRYQHLGSISVRFV